MSPNEAMPRRSTTAQGVLPTDDLTRNLPGIVALKVRRSNKVGVSGAVDISGEVTAKLVVAVVLEGTHFDAATGPRRPIGTWLSAPWQIFGLTPQ